MAPDFSNRIRRLEVRDDADNRVREALARKENESQLRSLKLREQFPELYGRLHDLMRASKADPVNLELAGRHVISSEALAVVLERRLKENRPCPSNDEGELVAEYGRVAMELIARFSTRTEDEQQRIRHAYPETDLDLVRRGCDEGILDHQTIGGVLEDSFEYDGFLLRLRPPPTK